MLGEIRALVTEYPQLIPQAVAYVRNADEPFIGRYLGLVGLSAPHSTEHARALGELLSSPPDLRLILALLSWSDGGSGDTTWKRELAGIQRVNSAQAWKLQVPWERHDSVVRALLKGSRSVDLQPILEGLMDLAERNDADAEMPAVMSTLGDMESQGMVKGRFKVRLDALYTVKFREARTGWQFSLDHIFGRGGGEPDFQTIGEGLPKLEPEAQVRILTEIARVDLDRLFKAPFRERLAPAITWLSKPASDTNLRDIQYPEFLLALVRRAGTDSEIGALFAEPSPTLKKRLAQLPKR